MQVRNLALILADLAFALGNHSLELGYLAEQLFFAALTGGAHIVLLFFDEAEQLVDAGLHLRS